MVQTSLQHKEELKKGSGPLFAWPSVCLKPITQHGLNPTKVGGKVRRFLHVRRGPKSLAVWLLDRFPSPTDDDDGRLLIRWQATHQGEEGVAVRSREVQG